LDREREDTTIPLLGFFIANQQQLQELQQLCEYVEIDTNRSIDSSEFATTFAQNMADIEVIPINDWSDNGPSTLEPVQLLSHTERDSLPQVLELDFFNAFGEKETIRQNITLFDEGQKPNRLFWQHNKMYLLVKGEVGIFVDGKKVSTIKAGEIFGELTPLILTKRSATVVTNCECELFSLNESQLVSGLEKKPEFALLLMDILIKRLRQAVEDAKALGLPNDHKVSKSIRVFSNKMIRELKQKSDDSAVTHLLANQTIFRKGAIGMLMYVIIEGHVITCIDDKIIERSGPGCVIGEIALVDQNRRLAHVVAETDCSLLAINRQLFLELVNTKPAFSTSLLQALASRLRFWRTGEPFQGDQ